MRLPEDSDTRYDDEFIDDSPIQFSNQIEEIAAALSNALSDIHDAPKTATAFNYKYAPFDEVMPIVRAACHKNGLYILQSPCTPSRGTLGVTTLLTHKSGQWIKTQYAIPFKGDGKNVFHQGGTSTTYLRRYAVMALMSMAAEDDDAQSQTAKKKPEPDKPSKASELLKKAAKVGPNALSQAHNNLPLKERKTISIKEMDALKKVASATKTIPDRAYDVP